MGRFGHGQQFLWRSHPHTAATTDTAIKPAADRKARSGSAVVAYGVESRVEQPRIARGLGSEAIFVGQGSLLDKPAAAPGPLFRAPCLLHLLGHNREFRRFRAVRRSGNVRKEHLGGKAALGKFVLNRFGGEILQPVVDGLCSWLLRLEQPRLAASGDR